MVHLQIYTLSILERTAVQLSVLNWFIICQATMSILKNIDFYGSPQKNQKTPTFYIMFLYSTSKFRSNCSPVVNRSLPICSCNSRGWKIGCYEQGVPPVFIRSDISRINVEIIKFCFNFLFLWVNAKAKAIMPTIRLVR